MERGMFAQKVPAYSADVHWLEEWAPLRFPSPCSKFSKGNYDWARQCYSWWCQCQASLEEIASEISVLYLKGYQSLWNSLPDMNGNGSLYHSHPASGVVPTKIVSWLASQWQSKPHSARAWSSIRPRYMDCMATFGPRVFCFYFSIFDFKISSQLPVLKIVFPFLDFQIISNFPSFILSIFLGFWKSIFQ